MNAISFTNLNWFDYTIIGVIALSMLISFARGFLREAISLLTWIIAILVAFKYALPMGEYLKGTIQSPSIRYTIAFVTIFIVIFIMGVIINTIIKRLTNHSGVNILDRLLGVVFGAARGILLVSIVLLFISLSDWQKSTAVQQSKLAPQFRDVISWLNEFLPEQMQKVSKWATDEIDHIKESTKPQNEQSAPSAVVPEQTNEPVQSTTTTDQAKEPVQSTGPANQAEPAKTEPPSVEVTTPENPKTGKPQSTNQIENQLPG